MLLWLWCRPAAAALIRPLVWELAYAAGVDIARKKKKRILTYWTWTRLGERTSVTHWAGVGLYSGQSGRDVAILLAFGLVGHDVALEERGLSLVTVP